MSKVSGISGSQPVDYNGRSNKASQADGGSFASYMEESIDLDDIFERHPEIQCAVEPAQGNRKGGIRF